MKREEPLFITFEGGEGAGKSTLLHKLYQQLQQRSLPVIATKEPGGTPVGRAIRKVLLDPYQQGSPIPSCELFLFLADRAQHVEELILPALRGGTIILCDRFNDSTLAYQAEEHPLPSLETLCQIASQGIKPDLTFYIDIDPEEGLRRVGKEKDRIEQKTLDFHRTIRKNYFKIVEKEPERFHLLDGTRPAEQLYQQALSLLPPHWQSQDS